MTALRSGRGQSPRHSLRTSLVTLQIALSVLLLAGGLAFGRAVREAFTLDLGFNTTRTAILSLNPSLVRSRRADFAALQDRSLVELLAKPWVRAAGWAAVRPLSGSMRWHLDIPDYTPVDPTEMYVESNVVDPRLSRGAGDSAPPRPAVRRRRPPEFAAGRRGQRELRPQVLSRS